MSEKLGNANLAAASVSVILVEANVQQQAMAAKGSACWAAAAAAAAVVHRAALKLAHRHLGALSP